MMKVKISDNEYLIILSLLSQAIEDEDCYNKEEVKEFEDLYKKLKEMLENGSC